MPRDDAGRWQKGSSGNPGGRPSMAAEVREALRVRNVATVALANKLARIAVRLSQPVCGGRHIGDHGREPPMRGPLRGEEFLWQDHQIPMKQAARTPWRI